MGKHTTINREFEIAKVGDKVYKISGKPFKSGEKINTVKGYGKITFTNGKVVDAYTFMEDETMVECRRCEIFNIF